MAFRAMQMWGSAGLCLMLGLSAAGLAQEKTPLEVQESGITASRGGARARIVLANGSTKPIAGYVVKADLFDASGQRQATTVHSALARSPHLPATTWRDQINVPVDSATGLPVKHIISVDYVLFSDGSAAGPDSQRHSLDVKGMFNGRRLERVRLKQLLKDQGVQAVAQDLAQP